MDHAIKGNNRQTNKQAQLYRKCILKRNKREKKIHIKKDSNNICCFYSIFYEIGINNTYYFVNS